MPKPIHFSFQGQVLTYQLNKIDRARLYGFKELDVVDDRGQTCELATLSDDGKTLVGRGGTGIGYLDADGNWVEKSKLTAVDVDGHVIQPVPSSFAAPIELKQETTMEDFLEHNVRLVYHLDRTDDSPVNEDLLKILLQGAIFKFNYSYRGGLEWDVGFLFMNSDQVLFFMVAVATPMQFVNLQQVPVTLSDDEPVGGDTDLMDFGMI